MTAFADTVPLIVGEATHPGEVGKRNEDDFAYFPLPLPAEEGRTATVAIVADGIGGSRGGEEASRTAVQTIKDYFMRQGLTDPLEDLTNAVREANRRIFEKAQENTMWQGMGTTVTVVVIIDGSLYVANVGDSRAYLVRDGEARQLTTDHTWAQEMIEAGRLTREEALRHPNRNVLKRYLGIEADVDVDLRLCATGGGEGKEWRRPLALLPGDIVLLCTDGLTDLVPDHDIATAVTRSSSPQRAADRLVNMARARGGYDNVTVLTLEVPGEPAKAGVGRGRLWAVLGIVAAVATLSAAAYALIGPSRKPREPLPASPTASIAVVLMSPTSVATPTIAESTSLPVAAKPTDTLAPVPSATPTSTPPMSEIVVTPSPTPSPTLALPLMPTPTSTPTRLVRMPSPVPSAAVPAPRLVEPVNDVNASRFVGDQSVTFRWEWSGQLAENQWFDVTFKKGEELAFRHTKDNVLELYHAPLGLGSYEWWVRIAVFDGVPDAGGKFREHIGGESERWQFRWCRTEEYQCNCRTEIDPITGRTRKECDTCTREVCD